MNLTLQNINKKYGNHTVLAFAEWKIESGIYWLKGDNGAGKTTLFKIIIGQTSFDGMVCLNGVNLKEQPIKFRAKVSYAEAEPQFPLFITGNELIRFYKKIRKAEQADVDILIDLFQIRSFLQQKIGAYSSGMIKKLSLICAFLGDMELYILDEPLITIDALAAAKLYNLISDKAKLGKSFLLSSHQEIDQNQLMMNAIFTIENKKMLKCSSF